MPPKVHTLLPESSGNIRLSPETVVLCIHRGRETVQDTYDSRHYTIEPGYFTTAYGAALHFKTRAVVPGSRNPETGFQASFIAILGVAGTPEFDRDDQPNILRPVDDPAEWEPFTDEECLEYGHAVEAIDRSSLVEGERDVQIVSVAGAGNRGVIPAAPSRVKANGAGTTRRRTQIVGEGAKALQKKNAAGQNDATRAIAQTRAEQSGDAPATGDDEN